MASGDTLAVFLARDNQPPASNPATLDTRNGHEVLDFDTTTQEVAIFAGVMPRNYAGGNIVATVHAALTSATSGTLGWDVAIEKTTGQDLDSDNFATAVTLTATTVPGTSGVLLEIAATISGASLAGLTISNDFRLRVRRDVANDTAAGDAELWAVELREA